MHKRIRVNRRNFLQGAAGLCFMQMLPACGHTNKDGEILRSEVSTGKGKEGLPVLPGYRPGVAGVWVPKGEKQDSYKHFKKMVEAATDFSWLSRGDRVLLKLALNSGNPFPATTDPWALWCMIRLLKEKGAGEIYVGDQSGVEDVFWTDKDKRGSSRKLCKSAGLLKIIQESGATPCFFEERGYDAYIETTPTGGSHWPTPLMVTSVVNEVDHIIYMARVSSHILGDITSGFKLPVGFLREDSRRMFHQGGEDFYAMYEEISRVPEILSKLRLSVSSGRSVLSNLGPNDGYISQPDYGLVLASEDLLAHELLSFGWLKWNRAFQTPEYSNGTVGRITRLRASLNKLFVWWVWKSRREGETQGIPFWQAGNIYEHPSVKNCLKREGGRPEGIHWEQVNSGPDHGVTDYLKKQLES